MENLRNFEFNYEVRWNHLLEHKPDNFYDKMDREKVDELVKIVADKRKEKPDADIKRLKDI